MGGCSDATQHIEEWQLLAVGREYCIVQDNRGREGQFYKIDLNPIYDQKNQMEIYAIRKYSKLPIIKPYDNRFNFQTGMMQVVTERITHTLKECPQLTYLESLFVLKEALLGYQELYLRCGPFYVNSTMIGFTAEGAVRVWHNSNFACNNPEIPINTLTITTQDPHFFSIGKHINEAERAMVSCIINWIQAKCEEGRFPESFGIYISNCLSFSQAQSLLSHNQYQSHIPNRIDLFRNRVPISAIRAPQ